MLIALLVGGLAGGCTVTAHTTPVRTEPPPPPPPPPAPVAQPAPPPPAPPPPPVAASRHPAYLHALTDLRTARAFLARPANMVVKWDEQRAIREIDAAIHEIKQAAIDDGKDLNDHEPLDRTTWGDRLQRSLELLKRARTDISEEEDSPSSSVHALRGRAFQHIGNAENMVKDGMADARTMREPEPPPPPPPPAPAAHPAYLHALTDLRMARALLERPAHNIEVKWDENRALGQIDAAIREIRDAAIDDNKPLGDHPPIDARQHHRDRIRTAIELLDKAARDIEQREDNRFAKGMRDRAIGHIRDAVRIAREASEDRRH
jgi:tetratricopeptide (TPR) repeat protein